MRYVLENTLLFDDQEGTLTGLTSGKSAKLPYAAVLLLKVFCEHPQILLGRNDLMDRAWTENGLRASGSNLYNSLSLIRRTVETLDVDLQIIRTQPKIGLIMEVRVERLDEPQQHEPASQPSAMILPASATEPEAEARPASEPETPTLNRQQQTGKKLALSFPAMSFYLLWTLLMVVLLVGSQLIKAHQAGDGDLSSERYDKMGALQQCKLFRLDDTSDVFPGEPVSSKIALLAKKYHIDCRNNRADFYVSSSNNSHNTYNTTFQLNIVCVSNKANNMAIDCFNDFVKTRRG